MSLGNELPLAPELLFNPPGEQRGLAKLLRDAVAAASTGTSGTNKEGRKELLGGLALVGGTRCVKEHICVRRMCVWCLVHSSTPPTSMLTGFEPRVRREFTKLILPEIEHQYEQKIQFHESTADPRNSAWIGGSVVAGFSKFSMEGWASRVDYLEEGPQCIWDYCRN